MRRALTYYEEISDDEGRDEQVSDELTLG